MTERASFEHLKFSNPEIWREVVKVMGEIESLVWDDPLVTDDLTRAEGVRQLTRLIAGGLPITMEMINPDYPQFLQLLSTRVQWGLPSADCHYVWAPAHGDNVYRIVGDRGTARVIDLEVREGHIAHLGDWKLFHRLQELEVGPNNQVEIIASRERPANAANWLQLPEGPCNIIFRNYFYDWEVEYAHYCGRTPVEVEIMGTENTPQVAFNPADAEIDLSSGLNEVSFTDQSQGGTSWLWDFGDGATSTMQNPTHTYADTGIYQVTLTVIGQEGCANSTSGTVTVTETNVSAVSRLAEEYGMEVFPNPAREQFYLSLSLPQPRAAEVFLADMLGRPVWRRQLEIRPGEVVEIPAAGLAPGLYSVVVRLDGKQIGRRVVVN